jgi:hypothetical protein
MLTFGGGVTALIDIIGGTEKGPGPERGEERRANQPEVVNVTALEPDVTSCRR